MDVLAFDLLVSKFQQYPPSLPQVKMACRGEKRDEKMLKEESIPSELAKSVAKKLQELKLPSNFRASTKEKGGFKRLFEYFQEIKELKADIATADSLQIREDMKAAARKVALETYRQAEKEAVRWVAEILDSCCWKLAGVVAKALMQEMSTLEKNKRQSAEPGNAAEEDEFPHCFFLHFELRQPADMSEFFAAVDAAFTEQFSKTAKIDDIGWLTGGAANSNGPEALADGPYLIVRAGKTDYVHRLTEFLAEAGAEHISVSTMFPC